MVIHVIDIKDFKLNLQEQLFELKGKADGEDIFCKFELFGKVDVNSSKYTVSGINTSIMLKKTDTAFWETLELERTKQTKQKIQVDWSRFVDEDEIEEAGEMPDFGDGMDFNNDKVEQDSDDEDEGDIDDLTNDITTDSKTQDKMTDVE